MVDYRLLGYIDSTHFLDKINLNLNSCRSYLARTRHKDFKRLMGTHVHAFKLASHKETTLVH